MIGTGTEYRRLAGVAAAVRTLGNVDGADRWIVPLTDVRAGLHSPERDQIVARLLEKRGGKSGEWVAEGWPQARVAMLEAPQGALSAGA